MKKNPINDEQAADENRSELEFARAMCFWSNLRFSLSQSRAREVTFDAAKRLLAARKAANDSAGTSTSARGGGPKFRPKASPQGLVARRPPPSTALLCPKRPKHAPASIRFRGASWTTGSRAIGVGS